MLEFLRGDGVNVMLSRIGAYFLRSVRAACIFLMLHRQLTLVSNIYHINLKLVAIQVYPTNF